LKLGRTINHKVLPLNCIIITYVRYVKKPYLGILNRSTVSTCVTGGQTDRQMKCNRNSDVTQRPLKDVIFESMMLAWC